IFVFISILGTTSLGVFKFMIVDFHVHAFPDKVADKAIETLESFYDAKCFSDGKIASLLDNMRNIGIDLSVVQPVSTDPRQVVSINTWSSGLNQKNGFPLIGFGTIHPKFEGYYDEIQRMKELGIKGVKFQPSFQEFFPDDEKMFPIYEELIKAGMVIVFHAGDEIRPASIVYSTPPRLARVLDVMHNLINDCNYYVVNDSQKTAKIVAAHLGGYQLWDQVEEYLLGREIYFDISYLFGHLDIQRIMRIIRSHGIKKILFGSDFPFAQPKEEIKTTKQLELTDEEREGIFSKNALKLLPNQKI
ncbi:MAG: Amidohydrolase, partial [Candidatus Poribacteria bacterium]|nr:Amidohydrolase [Candidatus Poribacteria bacterium]